MKRILTIQDISCLGKCSCTVALPILSAMGLETVILPTAVLSTHTMFKNFTCKDLSDQLTPITEHWKKENVKFDAIYTGYLGTCAEIEEVKHIIDTFKTNETMVFIDPAMADNGKLYAAFDQHYADVNATLLSYSDVTDPNITEACFMTGMDYREEYDESYLKELLRRLAKLGAKTAILTGVSLSEGKTGVMGLDRSGGFFSYQNDRIKRTYHGIGDVFSSVLAGAVTLGMDFNTSVQIACDYTRDTIAETVRDPKDPWYGVDFETTIPELIRMIEKVNYPSPKGNGLVTAL